MMQQSGQQFVVLCYYQIVLRNPFVYVLSPNSIKLPHLIEDTLPMLKD